MKRTVDQQIPCITPRIDCEDAGSLIVFIDHFLPMLNLQDEDSRDTASNVFRVREKLHQSLGVYAEGIPKGVNPL